ncbi:MAG: DUF3343 domain-containing protein [Pseudoflavonifractor sp.]
MDQIATFHTHFGAISFEKRLRALGDAPVLMPVPRRLSASCGTCVRFGLPFSPALADEELDRVYGVADGEYPLLFENTEG